MAKTRHGRATVVDVTQGNGNSGTLRSSSDRPWLSDPFWRDNRISSFTVFEMRHLLVLLGCSSIALVPLGYFTIPEMLSGNRKALIAIPLLLLLPYFLVSAIRKIIEWKRSGGVVLVMDPFPGSIGGEIGGSLEAPVACDPGLECRVFVTCSAVEVSSGDAGRSKSVIWVEDGFVSPETTDNGTSVSFKFSVPDGLPETDEERYSGFFPKFAVFPSELVEWTVRVIIKAEGKTGYDGKFLVPVFATGGVKGAIRGREATENLPPNRILSDYAPVVRLKELPGGLVLFFPAFGNAKLKSAPLVIGLFIVLSSSVTYYFFGSSYFILFSVFWFFALVLMLYGFWQLAESLEVTVTPRRITTLRRFLGIPAGRKSLAVDEKTVMTRDYASMGEYSANESWGEGTKTETNRILIVENGQGHRAVVCRDITHAALLDEIADRILTACPSIGLPQAK